MEIASFSKIFENMLYDLILGIIILTVFKVIKRQRRIEIS
jgi:hypothetical protein